MLHSINIQNGFAHQNATFDFTTGLTGITGPNASGKSEIITSIRFALFGSAALRTEVADYKKFRVELSFSIRGETYKVTRTTTSAKLFRNAIMVVSGTRPVNAKIIDLFGYGLEVFDTANTANQGLIESLSAMRPADRKKMVDTTVGLDVLDNLIRLCMDKVNNARKESEGINSVLREPEEPRRPDGWAPMTELIDKKQILLGQDGERRELERLVEARPLPGIEPPVVEPRGLAVLESMSRERVTTLAEIIRLKLELKGIPECRWTEKEIDDAEVVYAAYDFMAQHPKPDNSEAELELEMQRHSDQSDYVAWKKLNDAGHHTCPKCDHKWPVMAEDMGRHKDWANKISPPMAPTLEVRAIRRLQSEWLNYNATLDERATHTLVLSINPNTPTIPKLSIALARKGLSHQERRNHIVEQLAKLSPPADVSASLVLRKAYEAARTKFEAAQTKVADYEVNLPIWTTKLKELGPTHDNLTEHMDRMVAVQSYDKTYATFLPVKQAYQDGMDRLTVLAAQGQQYGAAKGALLDLKGRVKTYLVPSLSRVASHLVQRMTGGALQTVTVDDDFNITVDGKSIDGMSGAEKAAANLALRIGLGQVLTHRVFSTFMADEIDASMDDERAQFTAQCLRNLTSSISQIILVSHKEPDTDHYIRL